jgi:hypothetical protein
MFAILSLRPDQIEPAFDPVDTILEAIHASIETAHPLLERSHADLELVNVESHPIDLLVDPTQHDQNDVVRFVRHGTPYSAAIEGTAPSGVDDQV